MAYRKKDICDDIANKNCKKQVLKTAIATQHNTLHSQQILSGLFYLSISSLSLINVEKNWRRFFPVMLVRRNQSLVLVIFADDLSPPLLDFLEAFLIPGQTRLSAQSEFLTGPATDYLPPPRMITQVGNNGKI